MLATASAQVCVPLGHSSLYLEDSDDSDDDSSWSYDFDEIKN